MRFIILATVLLATMRCNPEAESATPQMHALSDTTNLKDWLSKVIIDYRNIEDSKVSEEILRSATTVDYYNYKSDNITLEYSSVSEKEFQEKWNRKFETKYVGNAGFFGWCQDCGPVQVLSCKEKSQNDNNSHIFHVTIRDIRWNKRSTMEVKVIRNSNNNLISDVKHYG